ncbi:MAG: sugar porter family MFS transporter [Solirubrobacterales bacterium]|nr:sugar porter family MFS transporter [Solirubrobacterales bacterium]MBV9715193.1 sugar porter family MFS transporter [Solirubrobacterales bacterium]
MSDAHAVAQNEQSEGGFRESFRWDVIRSTPRYAYLVAAVAALGGMLFGYDIGVISGAEKPITAQWKLSSGVEEFAVAAVLIGSIIGGLFGGKLADRISRRYSLMVMAVIYTIGAIATALAPNIALFIVFRIVVGVAVGASSMVVPTYIAELSPRQIRGGLVILQQLAISLGIFLSYIWDYISSSAGWGWRPMFAAAAVPGIALGVGMFYMSHTPRWLGMQGRWDEAEEVMGRVNPTCKDEELGRVREELENSERGSLRELMSPGFRGALIAGLGLAILQQFVGPNTVLFYGPTIFGYAGISAGSNGLLAEICVGAVLFLFVLPTIALVDVVGRKRLFYFGLTGMGSMLVLLGLAFHFGAASWGVGVLVILLVYIGCYSLSISPLFWLMTAELYPNRLRAIGASTATVANWSANLLITVTFLTAVDALGKDVVFWIYAAFAAVGLVFVRAFIPETRGRSLEEIEVYWSHGRSWPKPRQAAQGQASAPGGARA